MKLNPHNMLVAIDPPRGVRALSKGMRATAARAAGTRRWRCNCCGDVGTLDELRARACAYDYPPCKWCGMTPECALDCKGILEALSTPGVAVIG